MSKELPPIFLMDYKEKDMLEKLKAMTSTLKSSIDEYASDSIFSFLNCSFLNKYAKVVLKYIKANLGGNFYLVEIALYLAPIVIEFSVMFTLLTLNIIKKII